MTTATLTPPSTEDVKVINNPEDLVIQPPKKEEPPVVKEKEAVKGKVVATDVTFNDRIPANWTIAEVEGQPENITATNNITGKLFDGSIADFNATYFSK